MCGKMSSLRFWVMVQIRRQYRSSVRHSRASGNPASSLKVTGSPLPRGRRQQERGIVPQFFVVRIERLRAIAEPADETYHRLEHHAGLVAVRRVPAIGEAQQLDRAAGLLGDR